MVNNLPFDEKQEYQTLGRKVLWLFFLQIAPAGFAILIISLVLLGLSLQPVSTDNILGVLQNYTLDIAFAMFILSIFVIAISATYAWLTYRNYVFFMAEDSFKIKRGVFNKTENAIPYRQIQNVDIERDLMFQMLGLSRLIILTAGHEDVTSKGNEAEGIIPAIEKNLAGRLQSELLRRANIEKTTQV